MNELMGTAIELMLLGIVTVCVFLALLIWTTQGMSAVLNRMATNQKMEVETEVVIVPAMQQSGVSINDQALLKAISEAIKLHRSSQ